MKAELLPCICEGKGTCIGCLIETVIREKYGIQGAEWLAENVKGGEHEKV